MIFQIQTVTQEGREAVDTTVNEEYAMVLCRDYSMAFGSPCIVVREDEADFIRGQ